MSTKHKPDCQIYKAGGPGPNFYCDCQVDKRTPPAPTEDEVREAREYFEKSLPVGEDAKTHWWAAYVKHTTTILSALDKAQGVVEILAAVRKEWMEANEILGNPPDGPLCEMERQRDAARAENAAQAEQIKRLPDVVQRFTFEASPRHASGVAINVRPNGLYVYYSKYAKQAERIAELTAERDEQWKNAAHLQNRAFKAEAELAIYTGASVGFGGRGPIKCHKLIADAFNMLRDTLNEKVEPELGPHPLRAENAAQAKRIAELEAEAERYRGALEKIVRGEFDTRTAAIDMQGEAAKALEV